MVRTTILLRPETLLESEPLAVRGSDEPAVGMMYVRDGGGAAVVMGSPAELRALAVATILAAEQADEMTRVAELLADAGMTEHARS